ncbi:hypothetical protein DFH09DRAFT_1092766 [Mycena vulgaris]|nr:hypothetical protein DFH09DRAFT_1092766 [Mycena vulgaris]
MPTHHLPHRTRIASRTSMVQLEYSSKTGPLPKATTSDSHWTSIIVGNHDYAIDREWYEQNWGTLYIHRGSEEPESAEAVHRLLKGPRAAVANIVYLEGEEHRFAVREGGKEWSVYGAPYTPNPGGWAFGYKLEDGEALVSKFPKTDILLTHGPPHDLLDFTSRKDRPGCRALSSRLLDLKPRLHVFGHIHEARGAYLHLWSPGSTELSAQNAIQLEAVIEETFWTKSKSKAKRALKKFRPSRPNTETIAESEAAEQTCFVNAANSPAGPNSRRDGVRVKVGGPGFQPVIVDLMD